MITVHVRMRVKPGFIEAFRAASAVNAAASLQEPGIAQFDLLQDLEDPSHFVLVEVYKTKEAGAAHKETAHYQRWRDTVAPMMAEPRSSARLQKLFPPE